MLFRSPLYSLTIIKHNTLLTELEGMLTLLCLFFLQMSEMELKAFGSGIDIKPGTPPIGGRSTTPTSSPFRATSTSPKSQSSKMSSVVYQKQFQSAPATVRMAQPFPAQFAPQVGRPQGVSTVLVMMAGLTKGVALQSPCR